MLVTVEKTKKERRELSPTTKDCLFQSYRIKKGLNMYQKFKETSKEKVNASHPNKTTKVIPGSKPKTSNATSDSTVSQNVGHREKIIRSKVGARQDVPIGRNEKAILPPKQRVTNPLTPISFWPWVKEHSECFAMATARKVMHEHQLYVIALAGPNHRTDFHVQRGEEIFMMLKGEMCLKVLEHGKHKDVPIQDGQVVIVPARVPHSPRRYADSMGITALRLRDSDTELDCIRWYAEKDGVLQEEVLFEDWIFSDDVSNQPIPQVEKFKKTEQYKTGKPIPGAFTHQRPYEDDDNVDFPEVVDISKFIEKHHQEIDDIGRKSMFDEKLQSKVHVYGKGERSDPSGHTDLWIHQWVGSSLVNVWGEGKKRLEAKHDSLFVPHDNGFTITQQPGSYAMVWSMDPCRSTAWPSWSNAGVLSSKPSTAPRSEE